MYWDVNGWYLEDEELRDEYEALKAKGETGCDSFESYEADKLAEGTIEKCENMFCRNCIDAICSKGERVWTNGEYIEGTCEWCEEEDEVTWCGF